MKTCILIAALTLSGCAFRFPADIAERVAEVGEVAEDAADRYNETADWLQDTWDAIKGWFNGVDDDVSVPGDDS